MRKDVFMVHTALAPIIQSQPGFERKSTGNMTFQRQEYIVVRRQDSVAVDRLPVLSGNSTRSVGRRLFITKVLDELGFINNNIIDGLPVDVAETLISGGTMGAGKGQQRDPLIERYVGVYSELPFFGLFGGCYQATFFPGRLAVGFAYPVTAETYPLIKAMNSPFTSTLEEFAVDGYRASTHRYVKVPVQNVKGDPDNFDYLLSKFRQYDDFTKALLQDINTEGEEKPAFTNIDRVINDLTGEDELFITLKNFFGIQTATTDNAKRDIKKKIRSLTRDRNIFGVVDAIIPGTKLHARISLLPGFGDDNLMESTFDAYCEIIASRGYWGGMASRGYGAVATEIKIGNAESPRDFAEVSKADQFWNWLKENREMTRNNLLNLKNRLFGMWEA